MTATTTETLKLWQLLYELNPNQIRRCDVTSQFAANIVWGIQRQSDTKLSIHFSFRIQIHASACKRRNECGTKSFSIRHDSSKNLVWCKPILREMKDFFGMVTP